MVWETHESSFKVNDETDELSVPSNPQCEELMFSGMISRVKFNESHFGYNLLGNL